MENDINYEKRDKLVTILYSYVAMFNLPECVPFGYAKIQEISPLFPLIDDKDFWNKLNSAFIGYCNMDIQKLEEYLTKSPMKVDTDLVINFFELIKAKK